MTENSDQTGSTDSEEPELCGGTTGFIMMMLMFVTMFIMFNIELRIAIAYSLDGVFNPIFGFGGKYPVPTLLCTSIFLVFCSTCIRHYMTDWVEVARAQKLMNSFQKEKLNAMQTGNTVKMKKLEELSPEISKHQMRLMTYNLKPVIFTMIFFIVVFPWLWMVYFERLEFTYISLPGISKWNLTDNINICPIPWGQWILVYMILSLPLGLLIQNTLKYVTFTHKIAKTELTQKYDLKKKISALDEKVEAAQKKGIKNQKTHEFLSQAGQRVVEKKYTKAANLINEAESDLEAHIHTFNRITGLIAQADTMIQNAKNKGININAAVKSLEFSRKALKRNDDTSAIYYAKKSQRNVKEARASHKEAEETLSSVKALMYDLREVNTESADNIFKKAIDSMDKKDYSNVILQSKAAKLKAKEIGKLNKEAIEALAKVKNALDTIKHMELDVPKAQELFLNANKAFEENRYQDTLELADQCNELITNEREIFQNAQESVSFAKLVVANAVSFGASVLEAEKLVANAEVALTNKNYNRAIELANRAKDIAEDAKRQQQRIAKRR